MVIEKREEDHEGFQINRPVDFRCIRFLHVPLVVRLHRLDIKGKSSLNSPLTRTLLAVLGGYFTITLMWIVWDWIEAEYPTPPKAPARGAHIQHPFHHRDAIEALRRFSLLPEKEKEAIRENLQENLISIAQWLALPEPSDFQIMCMGELHEESTRKFLADEIFAKLPIDVLMLEATPQTLNGLVRRMESGRAYFPLLNADIMKILRTVKNINPGIEIYGIEETRKQEHEIGSRERSIAQNFWNHFHAGSRHLILFGALHCANDSNWLYHNLRSQAPIPLKERMLSVKVLEEHQNGPLEAFVYFLDAIGIRKKVFVIADARSLHPKVGEFFARLDRQVLKKYDTLIVFRI